MSTTTTTTLNPNCVPCGSNYNPGGNPNYIPTPCDDACEEIINTGCLTYNGIPINCLDIDTGDSLHDVIIKMAQYMCGQPITTSTTTTTSSTTTTTTEPPITTSTTTTTTLYIPDTLVIQTLYGGFNPLSLDIAVEGSNIGDPSIENYCNIVNHIPSNLSILSITPQSKNIATVDITNNSVTAVSIQVLYSQNNGGSFTTIHTFNLNPGQTTGAYYGLNIPIDYGANGNNILRFSINTASSVTTTTTQAPSCSIPVITDVIVTDNTTSTTSTSTSTTTTSTSTTSTTTLEPNVLVENSVAGASISAVTGIAGFSVGSPIGNNQFQSGNQTGFTSSIAVTITGSLPSSGLVLKKNGIVLQCITVGGGTYVFNSFSFTSSDFINIELEPTPCSTTTTTTLTPPITTTTTSSSTTTTTEAPSTTTTTTAEPTTSTTTTTEEPLEASLWYGDDDNYSDLSSGTDSLSYQQTVSVSPTGDIVVVFESGANDPINGKWLVIRVPDSISEKAYYNNVGSLFNKGSIPDALWRQPSTESLVHNDYRYYMTRQAFVFDSGTTIALTDTAP